MVRLRSFASLILIIMLTFPVFAGNANTGTVGGAFLKLGNGVRAPAMGEAFTAVADDASAIYWNPAGIAQLKAQEVSMSYNTYLQSTNYSTIHYVAPILPGQTVGASIFYMGYGDIAETTATSRVGTGRSFSPSGTIGTISYAYQVMENLFIGANFKALNQSIDSYAENGTGLDFGLLLKDYRGIDIGAVVQNIGSVNGASLPQTLKIGIARKFIDSNLVIAFDANQPKDNNAFLALGGEYQLNPLLKIRAGYNTKSEEGAGGNFGLGLGLNLSRFTVDYAYVPYGDLGGAHRVGLRVGL